MWKSSNLIPWCSCLPEAQNAELVATTSYKSMLLGFVDQISRFSREFLLLQPKLVSLCLAASPDQLYGVVLLSLRVLAWTRRILCLVLQKVCNVCLSYCVQSSAYLHELTLRCPGIESSRSLIWTLNSVGEITEPWGTPARHITVLDFVSPILTCWLLSSRKLFVHIQKLLFTLSSASFLRRMPWSTKSKAFRKSKNNACTPDLPSFELSVALYQFWDKNVNAISRAGGGECIFI